MQRFFLNNFDKLDFDIDKKSELFHQITKVLRLKSGEKVIFFDCKDNYDYIFEINNISDKEINFRLIDKIEKNNISKVEINLYQAIPNKIEKIELILQKGCEVGISNFYFYYSNRSQKINISEKKITRFNKIICEAIEQCGRNFMPKIIFMDKIFYDIVNGKSIFLHTKNENSKLLKDVKIENGKLNIFVGPEGGFDDSENQTFRKLNFEQVYLGENILRTETAGVVVAFYFNQV